MDVRCERCSTDYEFDDALVSGRGTTVKCTNCGHKFKIRRRDGDFSEDFWNIQTEGGKTLVFTSLRELQRAIQSHLVEPPDLLSRGGLKQKPIGQIPELQPFFDQAATGVSASKLDDRATSPKPPVLTPSTTVAPPGELLPSPLPPPPDAVAAPISPAARPRMSTRPDFLPPLSEAPPPMAPVGPVAQPAPIVAVASSGEASVVEAFAPSAPSAREPASAAITSPEPPIPPATAPHPLTSALPLGEPPSQGAPWAAAPEPVAEPAAETVGGEGHAPKITVPPPTDREEQPDRFAREHGDGRAALVHTQPLGHAEIVIPKHTPPPVFEVSSPLPPPAPVVDLEPRDSLTHGPSLPGPPSSIGRRRGVGGYIISVIVLAGVAILGIVYAKDHLGSAANKGAASGAAVDPRVAGLLGAGERAVAEGNLELAKESFDKASVLAEKDPHVLLDVARLAAVRADVPWLKARLLTPDAVDDARLTKENLTELSAAARKAADDALAASPDDAAALRAKVDALRINGERDAARLLVAKVGSSGQSPDTAYVLAALDLAESDPLWSTVIERLRTAANVETGPGRARAALVYALARSGDGAGAKAEVDRLAAMSRQHPLLPQLRAFAANANANASASAKNAPALPAASVLGDADAGAPGKKGDKADKGKPSGDVRQLVQQAETARAKGDLDRAQALFGAALDRNPKDTEALSGMAAIAHARHDLNGARESYKRVLSFNPSYVPALVGLGDCEYESGDKAAAVKTYRDIIDRFPPGTYPARVRQRAGAGGDAPAPTPSSSSATDPGGGG